MTGPVGGGPATPAALQVDEGSRLTAERVAAFAEAGVHRLVVLAPPTPDGPAAAIDAALADPAWATRAGADARSYALAHHTPEVVVPQLRAVYEAVAA